MSDTTRELRRKAKILITAAAGVIFVMNLPPTTAEAATPQLTAEQRTATSTDTQECVTRWDGQRTEVHSTVTWGPLKVDKDGIVRIEVSGRWQEYIGGIWNSYGHDAYSAATYDLTGKTWHYHNSDVRLDAHGRHDVNYRNPDAAGPAHVDLWVVGRGQSPACFFRSDAPSKFIIGAKR